MKTIGLIGAGAWGTALALYFNKIGKTITLWVREPEVYETIKNSRENKQFLPGFNIPESIFATESLKEAVADKEIVLLAVPSHGMRNILSAIKTDLSDKSGIPKNSALLCAAKGIETETQLRMSEIAEEVFGAKVIERWATLSGPSFAREVAQAVPTVVAVASKNAALARELQTALSSDIFRIYSTSDLVGVELGGALKNVIAIASGMVSGLGFGYNTQAALITRGLVEITRLAVSLGANRETLIGAAGIGDLFLTATGTLSRNREVGVRLGKGENIQTILSSTQTVAEGVKTTKSAYYLAKKHGVEMPITAEIYKILYEGKSPADALKTLLERELKKEGLRLDD